MRPLFSRRPGHEAFGKADDWPLGHAHYFLTKRVESTS
jgi:hypothetical protein